VRGLLNLSLRGGAPFRRSRPLVRSPSASRGRAAGSAPRPRSRSAAADPPLHRAPDL